MELSIVQLARYVRKPALTITSILVLATLTQPTVTRAQAAAGTGTLEEVVVTAERREESAQKLSVAIDVVTADDIRDYGVTQATDINRLVPAVNITSGPAAAIAVRGVGGQGGNQAREAGVAFQLDGVYLVQAAQYYAAFMDIARIEVLKGPQGTLYGRNASGGVFNVITQNPLHEFGGDASAEIGNYNRRVFTGALNVPVSESFALRGSVMSARRDGYNTDGTNDQDMLVARLKALWTPTDAVSLLLTGDVGRLKGKGTGTVLRPAIDGEPRIGVCDPRYYVNTGLDTFVSTGAGRAPRADSLPPCVGGIFSLPPSVDHKDWGLAAELNWKLRSDLTLTNLAAYREQTAEDTGGQPFTSGGSSNSTQDGHQFSDEIRLSYDTERLKVVGGFYYLKYQNDYVLNLLVAFSTFSVPSIQHPHINAESWAPFAQINFSVTDDLRLIGGARYTHDEKSTHQITDQYGHFFGLFRNLPQAQQFVRLVPNPYPQFINAFNPFAPTMPGTTYSQNYDFRLSDTYTDTTYKLGVEYDLAPDKMLYATFSTGFKSGDYSFASPAAAAYNPEYIDAYTLGSKNRFLGNKLQFNLEAYYWKYKDQQVTSVDIGSDGLPALVTRNAANSNIKGAEVELAWRFTPADTLTADVQYQQSEYSRYTFDQTLAVNLPLLLPPSCPYTDSAPVDGSFVRTVDCSGNAFVNVPEWKGMLGYLHVFNLSNGANLTFRAAGRFQSKTLLDLSGNPLGIQKAWGMGDVDLGYTAPSKRWSLTTFVRNVTDEVVYISASPSLLNEWWTVQVEPPRTYGMRLDLKF